MESREHAGLESVTIEFGHDTDAQALDVCIAHRLGHRRPILLERGRVVWVVSGDDIVQECGVENRASNRADLIEAGCEGDCTVTADSPVGGLDAHGASDVCGLTNRASGIGAEGERRFESRDSGCRATAGSAGDSVEVPRVSGWSVCGVFGGRSHGELIHVGLAQRDEPCFANLGDGSRVVRTHPAFKNLRPTCRGHVGCDENVFDGDGHAIECADRRASRATSIRRLGGSQRDFGVHVEECVHVTVNGSDAVEVRLSHLN